MNNLHNEIEIRKVNTHDLNELAVLTTELGYKTTTKQMSIRLRTLSSLENYWTFVAEKNKVVVGYIGLCKNYFWEQDGFYLRVQSLVVKKEERKTGVGVKLMKKAEELAESIGAKLITLNCGNREERVDAHKFYSKIGYIAKSTGYRKDIIKKS